MARSLTTLLEHSSPVVSLAVFNRSISSGFLDPGQHIQVVVRDPATNSTHPNVVSVPTARLPRAFFDALLASAEVIGEHGTTTLCTSEEVDSETTDGHNPLIFVVRSIFAQKLGVADALESDWLAFRAEVNALACGQSWYSSGHEKTTEQIAMININVTLTKGAEQFPSRTASYSHLMWAPIPQFVKAVQFKDPSLVGLHGIDLCIHGFCISSTYDSIASKCGLQPFDGLWARALADD